MSIRGRRLPLSGYWFSSGWDQRITLYARCNIPFRKGRWGMTTMGHSDYPTISYVFIISLRDSGYRYCERVGKDRTLETGIPRPGVNRQEEQPADNSDRLLDTRHGANSGSTKLP